MAQHTGAIRLSGATQDNVQSEGGRVIQFLPKSIGLNPVILAFRCRHFAPLEGKDRTISQQLHTIISVNAGIAVAPYHCEKTKGGK